MEENQNSEFEEKRLFPRCDMNLPVKITGGSYKLASETKNISGCGLYCSVDRFIPTMTKISLTMFIPLIDKGRRIEKEISCMSVVVRIYPETMQGKSGRYDVGLFFTDIHNDDRELILQYLRQSMCSGNN